MADVLYLRTNQYPLLALSQKDQVWCLWPRWLTCKHSCTLHSWKPCGAGPKAGRMGLFCLQQPLLNRAAGAGEAVHFRGKLIFGYLSGTQNKIRQLKEIRSFCVLSFDHSYTCFLPACQSLVTVEGSCRSCCQFL